MILLIGAGGYIGRAFEWELKRRELTFRTVKRSEVDFGCSQSAKAYLSEIKPAFVINAAGYTGKPNVDACETNRADTLLGNVVLPLNIGRACESLAIPWGNVATGCIYDGPSPTPDGFTEEDEPNFCFRSEPCSFYSGSKALAEESLACFSQLYQWRLRIPFDHLDSSRNYLSKLLRYAKLYDAENSISHRGDFVKACLDSWEQRIPFGIYNLTNPGFVSTRSVVERIKSILTPDREFEYWEDDSSFYREAAITPRSNCRLSFSKAAAAGLQMRPVEEAVDEALRCWVWESKA